MSFLRMRRQTCSSRCRTSTWRTAGTWTPGKSSPTPPVQLQGTARAHLGARRRWRPRRASRRGGRRPERLLPRRRAPRRRRRVRRRSPRVRSSRRHGRPVSLTAVSWVPVSWIAASGARPSFLCASTPTFASTPPSTPAISKSAPPHAFPAAAQAMTSERRPERRWGPLHLSAGAVFIRIELSREGVKCPTLAETSAWATADSDARFAPR